MAPDGVWVTQGFEAFREGTFGNAGHNLYVSRGGTLQRIHQFDLNGDGYVDLLFCNSQNHWEMPPAYVYRDPLGAAECLELPADGAWSGAVADLNGDGYDDLVVGNSHNGIVGDLHAIIYYGSESGFTESHQHRLPVPGCTSVAAGDFNGDGRLDLAFLTRQSVRIFYQNELGFEALRGVDLDIEGAQLCAGDLDGDGADELVCRISDGATHVYWGGAGGIDPDRVTSLGAMGAALSDEDAAQYAEYVRDATPLPRVILLGDVPHLFVTSPDEARLNPVRPSRQMGAPLIFGCAGAMAVGAGDVNGDGCTDLVFACRSSRGDPDVSWVYWGADGFDDDTRTSLATCGATDVVVEDLDGDGCAEIVVGQYHTDELFTSESLIYRGSPNGVDVEPTRLVSHDARRIFVARPSADRDAQVVVINHFARSLVGDIPVAIYLGGADGYAADRRWALPGWGAVDSIVADFNDDGRPDVLIGNAAENSVHLDPGSWVFLNRDGRLPDTPDWTLPTTRSHGLACADIDRDGYLDVVSCGFNNSEILVFHGTNDGFDVDNPDRIVLEHEGTLYDQPRWVYLVDLDNDGWLDLVVPQIQWGRSFVFWGGPQGFSMERCQALSVTRAACARAADLTGNGYADLILGGHMPTAGGPHDSFVYIYWNGPDGLRQDRRTLLPANTVNAMCLGDFDGDGFLDLFVCSYHDGRTRDIDSYLYWNREGRGFSADDRTALFTHSASGCVAADFDEDGRLDLAIAYHKEQGDHMGRSAVWWNGPDGLSPDRVTRLPTSGPHGMTSIEPGNLLDRGPDEYYVSTAHKLPEGACITGISWDAELGEKTWVRAQYRCAGGEDQLQNAPWLGADGETSWLKDGQAVGDGVAWGRWLQYRLALGATNSCGTPRVSCVRVHYA